MFVAASADQGHALTGSALGVRFLEESQMEVVRNFQYAVGQNGM